MPMHMAMTNLRLDQYPILQQAPPAGAALLQEDGVSYILLEDGSRILLES